MSQTPPENTGSTNPEPHNNPGPPHYQTPQGSEQPTSQPSGAPVAGQPAYNPGQQANTGYGYTPQQNQGFTQPGGSPARGAGTGEPNFFKALFDFSFKNFVTIRFAGVLFGVGLAAIVLGWLIFTIAAFTDSAAAGMLMFVFGAVFAFVYIILFRVTIEFYVAMVRTAQNTSLLVEQNKR
ncbi:DUF4282 domain-containing protein [Kocuria sp.]|uniref:DUF4282 domain-containing protein n=1 Tax=Kocuria sp. TaxID=1871328 RepID=UPI0026DF8454|nr:DUF4282 domain-containing protein [Kocuria sp.]MDO5618058.1 DUF4282 domain-containing protein [Kocuria sp.]